MGTASIPNPGQYNSPNTNPNQYNTGQVDANGNPIYGYLQPGDFGYTGPSQATQGGIIGSGGGGGSSSGGSNTVSYPSIQAAIQAWQQAQLNGSNTPLSSYIAAVAPQGQGAVPSPTGTKETSTTSGTGTSETTGTGTSNSTSSRTLPPAIEAQLNGFIGNLLGKSDYGYTPQEIAQMQIDPNEARGLVSQALQPTVGAANAARQQGLMASAARGNYAPGLNATLEKVQQQQGQQAGQIASQTRLGITAQNRDAAIAAANARLADVNNVRNQTGGLLQNYPESTTTNNGSNTSNTSGTNTTSSTGTNTTLPVNAQGGALPINGLRTGQAGVLPKANTPAAITAKGLLSFAP